MVSPPETIRPTGFGDYQLRTVNIRSLADQPMRQLLAK